MITYRRTVRLLLGPRSALQWRIRGGCTFPFLPNQTAWTQAALWHPCEAPSIIIYQQGKSGQRDTQINRFITSFDIANERADNSGRHLVLQRTFSRFRLVLRHAGIHHDIGYVVEPDDWLGLRLTAISALHQASRSEVDLTRQNSFAPSPYQRHRLTLMSPSPYQRHRLTLMLRILDCIDRHSSKSVTTRDIAEQVVYPRFKLGRAAEWKVSSERRNTQRLSAEARSMMKMGYRHLLKGRLAGSKSRA